MRIQTRAAPGRRAADPRSARRLLSGWGRTSPSAALVRRPASVSELGDALARVSGRGVIARGLGRSYGDLAQNAGGTVLDLTALNGIRALDQATGLLSCEAGCSLAEIIAHALPRGWFLPVVPGTCFITAGGAVACDVHGKNHHRDGSFGGHVASLTLLTPGGELRELDPERTPDEFRATVGGLGLTGFVVDITVRLLPVESGLMRVTTERAPSLDDALERLAATDHLYRYSVAWVDCAARGSRFGRAVLMRGDHAELGELASRAGVNPQPPAREPRIRVPAFASIGPLIRNSTLQAFNDLYYRRAREDAGALQSLGSFFFPLDAIGDWNRLYGRAGFLQYQFVLPFGAEDSVRQVMRLLSGGARRPTLVVLKRFGDSSGLLSFPAPGWTVACDLPLPAPGLAQLLDRADEIVVSNGGRVYLAKDSRLRPEHLAEMYPRLERWREIRSRLDPSERMQSDLARRLMVTRVRAGAR
jgi:decaprenylphospho-beta-D-ribofuranose 2-oxidase